MRLTILFEASPFETALINATGKYHFKKLQDPGRPEKLGTSGHKMLPMRSGQQDTPLTPRLRRYFNAPTGAQQGKIGYQDVDDAESRRPRPVQVGDQGELDYPIEKSLDQQEIEKKARKAFGHLSQHGGRIRKPTTGTQ